MEQAEHELLRSVALSVFMQMDGQEITWPRVSSKCDFRSMAKFEEVLEVATSIAKATTYKDFISTNPSQEAFGGSKPNDFTMHHDRS